MSNWTCAKCQYTYNSDDGDIVHGVLQGTDWQSLPGDWHCPDCGALKIEFTQTGGDKDGSGWTAN